MTAAQLAQHLNARRAGKGKWVAKCPSHPDRTPSLSIAEGRKVPVVLKCMSAGCDTKAILAAVGLTWNALFDGKPTPQVRARTSRQEQRERMERQLGLVIMLGAVEKDKKAYWAAAERRIRREIHELRCWLEPEKVVAQWREWQFQERVRRIGWDGIWSEFERSDTGRDVLRQYGTHIAGTSTKEGTG